MKTICLNMIVKNESRVIARCLASVKHLLDSWVIVDTGSDDGTEAIVEQTLSDLPGQLHRRPWIDFAANRNEALALAAGKADYLLFIDADEVLELLQPLDKQMLAADCYLVKNRDRHVDFYRILMVRSDPAWRWEGVLHEELVATKPMKAALLEQATRYGLERDSFRSRDSSTYLKDAEVLQRAVAKDPQSTRAQFYLAQSYGAARDFPRALEAYEKRAAMGGFADEVFLSHYFAATLRHEMNQPLLSIAAAYAAAIANDGSRAEPYHGLAQCFYHRGHYLLCYLLTKAALELGLPQTLMYVRRSVYDYSLFLYFASSAQAIGKRQEAIDAYRSLKNNSHLNEQQRRVVATNLSLLETASGSQRAVAHPITHKSY